MRSSFLLVALAAVCATGAENAPLDTVCLHQDVQLMLDYAAESDTVQYYLDSLGITAENVSTSGNCDSTAILLETVIGAVRIGTVKKIGSKSCSLNVVMELVEMDTVVNACELTGTRPGSMVRSLAHYSQRGSVPLTITNRNTSWVPYSTPQEGSRISIYSASGVLIRELGYVHGAGKIAWDGKDQAGSVVSPGTYFMRVSNP